MRQAKRILLLGCLAILAAPVLALGVDKIAWQNPKDPGNAAFIYSRSFLCMNRFIKFKNPEDEKTFLKALNKLAFYGEYDADVLDKRAIYKSELVRRFHKASRIDRCDFGIEWEDGYEALLPELSEMRQMARLVVLAARQAGRGGDWPLALALYRDTLQMSRHLNQQKMIINTLVGAVITDFVFNQVGAVLAEMPAREELYRHLGKIVEEVQPALSDWSAAMEGEIKALSIYFPPPNEVWSKAKLQKVLAALMSVAQNANKGERILKKEQIAAVLEGKGERDAQKKLAMVLRCAPKDLPEPSRLSAALSRNGAEIFRYLERMQAIMKLPYVEASARMEKIKAEVNKASILERTFLPAITGLHRDKAKQDAQMRMMRAAAAVMCWRVQNGRLPKTGDDILENLPTDPFTARKSFKYTILKGGGFSLESAAVLDQKRAIKLIVKLCGKAAE